jgi:DNA-directed RNA polymerase beta' subunit
MSKRTLTAKEIEDLLDFIQPQKGIPEESAHAIVEENKNQLRRQLVGQEIYPGILPKLRKELSHIYFRSRIEAGESVGILCAQSIGKKQTQSTLDSFHQAGITEKTMTTGVPRFQELINAVKKPNSVNHTIYLDKSYTNVAPLREAVADRIVGLTLGDLAKQMVVMLDAHEEHWYDTCRLLYGHPVHYPHCIRVKLDRSVLYNYKISVEGVMNKIQTEFDDVYCLISPVSVGYLDIFVDCSEIELPENRMSFIDQENKLEIYLEECVMSKLEQFIVCGIPGITELFFPMRTTGERIIETNGINSRDIQTGLVNFKQLLALSIVDECQTSSNNVWDIYDVLGVEAARQFLIDELMSILEGINFCHPELLVDRMTHSGTIASITRYTMKKDDSGPFGKASFEETMIHFLQAAAEGELEPARGVSASIVCGKRAHMGTGLVDLKLDMNKLMDISPT